MLLLFWNIYRLVITDDIWPRIWLRNHQLACPLLIYFLLQLCIRFFWVIKYSSRCQHMYCTCLTVYPSSIMYKIGQFFLYLLKFNYSRFFFLRYKRKVNIAISFFTICSIYWSVNIKFLLRTLNKYRIQFIGSVYSDVLFIRYR